MRPPEPVVLTAPHVTLEPLAHRHAPDLLEAARDERIWRWLSLPSPRGIDDITALVDAARADASRLAFAVLLDGHAVGSTSYLDIDVALGGVEIGWTWYHPSVWAGTVNPSCKLLLLAHAFDDLGVERVLFKTDALNVRSRGAIARLGARYDGTLRHHRRRPDGSIRDSAYFSLLVGEWPAARVGLEARLAAATSAAPDLA